MTDMRYVRLAKDEYDDADATRRNDKLSDKLAGESRNIRSLELRELASEGWRGWIARIDG